VLIFASDQLRIIFEIVSSVKFHEIVILSVETFSSSYKFENEIKSSVDGLLTTQVSVFSLSTSSIFK